MDNDGGQLILENFMSLQNMISTKTRYFWFGRATVVDQKWLPELSAVELTKKNIAELFESSQISDLQCQIGVRFVVQLFQAHMSQVMTW